VSVAATDWWRAEVPARATAPGAASAGASAPASPLASAPASPLAYGALLAFTCVLLLAPQNAIPMLGKLRLALLAASFAIVAHLRDRWALGLPATKPGREMRLVGLLLVWSVLTLPFSLWPGGSLALLLGLYVKALAVFWLIGNLVDTLPRLRGMAWTLTLLTVALALVGISNYLTGVFGATLDQRILGHDAGLTRNPNDLALMINLIIPLAVALLLSSAGGLVRVALAVGLLVQVVAVVLTFSRAGFLTLATTLGLYGVRLLQRPGRGLVLAALAVLLLGLPFLPASYTDRLLTLSSIDADPTGSARARWAGSVAALEHAVEHPVLGAGLGMNILVLNAEVGATWRSVHNTYLEYAVDLGLPGLALFGLLLRGCWSSARAARRSPDRELGALAEGIEISLVGFAVAGLFYPAAYEFFFYYVGGLAVAAKSVHARLLPVAAGAP
jgi:O-antigen ligase